MLGKTKFLLTLFILPFIAPLPVYATTYSSTNYSVQQVFFGAGGATNATDGTYNAQVSIGETGVGNYSDNQNYSIWSGFNTTSDPYLQFIVTAANLNLGVLSTSTTATPTATFVIRDWNSSGYQVVTNSPTPNNVGTSSYMQSPTTPTASATNTEQFGMNLVADTSPSYSYACTPAPSCANPQQSTLLGKGEAAGLNGASYLNSDHARYDETNLFNYNNGDIIAWSPSSSSSTTYTISYIFNIYKGTTGGQYIFNQDLIATGFY